MRAHEDDSRSAIVEREPATGGRELLMRVARRRFVADGYATTSMADIAADAGMTKAALYYHFPGKDALFVAVFIAEVERVVAYLEDVAASTGSLEAKLTDVATFAFLEAGDGVFRLHDDLLQHIDSSVRENSFKDRKVPKDVIVRIVQECAGELRDGLDPGFVARMFLGLVASRMQSDKWEDAQGPAGVDEARALVDVFLRGVQGTQDATAPGFGYADGTS